MRSKLLNNETSKLRYISMNIYLYIHTVSYTYKYVSVYYIYICILPICFFSKTYANMYILLPICKITTGDSHFFSTTKLGEPPFAFHPAEPREALALDLDQVTSKVKAPLFCWKQNFWETKSTNSQLHVPVFFVGCCVLCFFLGSHPAKKKQVSWGILLHLFLHLFF